MPPPCVNVVVVAVKQGEQPAGRTVDEVLVAAHGEQYVNLTRFAALVLADTAEAEDLVQEAFVRARSVWLRSGLPEVPAAYLRRAVANLCNSRLRRISLARRLGSTTQPAASAEHDALLRDDQRAVLDALTKLPVQQRTALCLRYYLDLTDVRVAEAMGVSLGSAKTHLRRGLARLTRLLEERDER
jgi:RNA polymerase sigma factor (sigma-70 family)